jgi:hypothetical protein
MFRQVDKLQWHYNTYIWDNKTLSGQDKMKCNNMRQLWRSIRYKDISLNVEKGQLFLFCKMSPPVFRTKQLLGLYKSIYGVNKLTSDSVFVLNIDYLLDDLFYNYIHFVRFHLNVFADIGKVWFLFINIEKVIFQTRCNWVC